MSSVISLYMAYPFRDGYYRRCFGFSHPKDTPPFSSWQSTTSDYNSEYGFPALWMTLHHGSGVLYAGYSVSWCDLVLVGHFSRE
jgi:hypothetical protein